MKKDLKELSNEELEKLIFEEKVELKELKKEIKDKKLVVAEAEKDMNIYKSFDDCGDGFIEIFEREYDDLQVLIGLKIRKEKFIKLLNHIQREKLESQI